MVEVQHLNTPMILFLTIVEYILKPYIALLMLQKINLTRKISEDTSNSKMFYSEQPKAISSSRSTMMMAVHGSDFSENRFQVQYLRNLKVKSHLSEVFKLTKLILVLPAINATSQRTFSLLKLIKNYIQSTMKQSWLKK